MLLFLGVCAHMSRCVYDVYRWMCVYVHVGVCGGEGVCTCVYTYMHLWCLHVDVSVCVFKWRS